MVTHYRREVAQNSNAACGLRLFWNRGYDWSEVWTRVTCKLCRRHKKEGRC